jgi:hypothetical protein
MVDAIEHVRSASERAGDHLSEAWRHLAGRDPLPDQAYFQAVLAVEAAARPIVTPNDSSTTLGRMIGTVDATPSNWTFALGDASDVVRPARLLWETHRRHGTDDREAPMGISQEEADAWFAGGAFKRA